MERVKKRRCNAIVVELTRYLLIGAAFARSKRGSLTVRPSPFHWRRFARERQGERRERESNWLFWFLDQDKEKRRSWAVGNKDLPDGPSMGSIQAGGDL